MSDHKLQSTDYLFGGKEIKTEGDGVEVGREKTGGLLK